jgi:hypothetical protein
MPESALVRIIIALIGATGVVVAAWIGVSNTDVGPEAKAPSSAVAPHSGQVYEDQGKPNPKPRLVSREGPTVVEPYEVTAAVGEGGAFVDPKTGFVFAADEITDFLGATGALSRYTLPDGTRGQRFRYQVGHRIDFEFKDGKYYMVIERIDYDKKQVHIKLKRF